MLDLANTRQQKANVNTIQECRKTNLSPFHPLWSKQVVLTGCADWTCYGWSALKGCDRSVWVWEAFSRGVTETVHCHYLAMKMAVKKGVIYFWLWPSEEPQQVFHSVSSVDSCHSCVSFMFMREHSLAFYVTIFWPLCYPLRVYVKLALSFWPNKRISSLTLTVKACVNANDFLCMSALPFKKAHPVS